MVSIPHRYAENPIPFLELLDDLGMFQSLIGMLKTLENICKLLARSQFQSLIGMLKTIWFT